MGQSVNGTTIKHNDWKSFEAFWGGKRAVSPVPLGLCSATFQSCSGSSSAWRYQFAIAFNKQQGEKVPSINIQLCD